MAAARIMENEDFARLLSEHSAGQDLSEDSALAPATNGNAPTPERWVVVSVSDAFIHCSKHVPQMKKVEREVEWGTDDVRAKGGDYFGAASGQK